jgi:hypothetical protein
LVSTEESLSPQEKRSIGSLIKRREEGQLTYFNGFENIEKRSRERLAEGGLVNAVEIQEFKLILQSSPFCEQIPRNMKLIQRGNHFKEGLIFSVGAEQSRAEQSRAEQRGIRWRREEEEGV